MDVIRIIDTTERDKIEAWTVSNTFPDVIKFIEDAKGNWIVGPEVLLDTAYEKIGNLSGTKEEPLKDYLATKSSTVVYEPKESDSEVAKAQTAGIK